MDDPLLVRRGEALRELHRVVDGLPHRDRAGTETATQRLALEELGDDVRRTLVRTEVVDGGDVRVVEHARGAGLLLEAFQAIGVLRERGGQHLDRDFAAEARVLRAVDLPHASRTELGEDLVGTEPRAGGERHFRPSTRYRSASTRWKE